jgi:hypothetical protein
MTESLKYEAKYLLTNRETADSLIYRLSFMIRDIEAESKKAGVVVDWPNILIETEDWSIDDRTLSGEDRVEDYRTIKIALRGVKED